MLKTIIILKFRNLLNCEAITRSRATGLQNSGIYKEHEPERKRRRVRMFFAVSLIFLLFQAILPLESAFAQENGQFPRSESSPLKSFPDILSRIWREIVDFWQKIWGWIKEGWDFIWQKMKSIFGKEIEEREEIIKEEFPKEKEEMKEDLPGFWQRLKELIK